MGILHTVCNSLRRICTKISVSSSCLSEHIVNVRSKTSYLQFFVAKTVICSFLWQKPLSAGFSGKNRYLQFFVAKTVIYHAVFMPKPVIYGNFGAKTVIYQVSCQNRYLYGDFEEKTVIYGDFEENPLFTSFRAKKTLSAKTTMHRNCFHGDARFFKLIIKRLYFYVTHILTVCFWFLDKCDLRKIFNISKSIITKSKYVT